MTWFGIKQTTKQLLPWLLLLMLLQLFILTFDLVHNSVFSFPALHTTSVVSLNWPDIKDMLCLKII